MKGEEIQNEKPIIEIPRQSETEEIEIALDIVDVISSPRET